MENLRLCDEISESRYVPTEKEYRRFISKCVSAKNGCILWEKSDEISHHRNGICGIDIHPARSREKGIFWWKGKKRSPKLIAYLWFRGNEIIERDIARDIRYSCGIDDCINPFHMNIINNNDKSRGERERGGGGGGGGGAIENHSTSSTPKNKKKIDQRNAKKRRKIFTQEEIFLVVEEEEEGKRKRSNEKIEESTVSKIKNGISYANEVHARRTKKKHKVYGIAGK